MNVALLYLHYAICESRPIQTSGDVQLLHRVFKRAEAVGWLLSPSLFRSGAELKRDLQHDIHFDRLPVPQSRLKFPSLQIL